jgi:predicted Zn-dependent peptidase
MVAPSTVAAREVRRERSGRRPSFVIGSTTRAVPLLLALRFALGRVAGHMDFYIRQANSLSYAAFAQLLENGATAGELYVSSPVPEKVVPLMRAAVQWAQTEPVLNSELREFTAEMAADLASGQSGTAAQQTEELATSQLYHGDYRGMRALADQLRKINGEDLLRAARRYMKNVQFVYPAIPRSSHAGS